MIIHKKKVNKYVSFILDKSNFTVETLLKIQELIHVCESNQDTILLIEDSYKQLFESYAHEMFVEDFIKAKEIISRSNLIETLESFVAYYNDTKDENIMNLILELQSLDNDEIKKAQANKEGIPTFYYITNQMLIKINYYKVNTGFVTKQTRIR